MSIRKLKKKKGTLAAGIFGLLVVFLIFIMFNFIIAKYAIVTESEIVHDSLVSSNLAALSSKDLDLDLLGENLDKKIVEIKDPNVVFQTFQKHIKNNLGLNDDYSPKNKGFIKSKINVKNFTIYNVNAATNDVIVYTLNTSTMAFSSKDYPGGKGNLKTPKGNIVDKTTIHSTIDFSIEIIFGKIKNVEVSEDTGTVMK